VSHWFSHVATKSANAMGHYWAFIIATLVCIVWAVSGPLFGFSDTWQLVINTGTTVMTFLMVFLIQNTQNRDAKAVQLKLDELIRTADRASNRLIDVENYADDELEHLAKVYERLASFARTNGQQATQDTEPAKAEATTRS
jgi:low affinity Fe/Cu permease